MKKVYLNDPMDPAAVERLKKRVELTESTVCPEELDAIIVRQQYCPGELIRRAKKLRLIQQHGVGLDRIDTRAARECGVQVRNTPGSNSRSVAEYALAMMLDLSRKVTETDRKTRAGRLTSFGMEETVGFEMTGKRLGLIGSGHAALELAQICRDGFRMEVCCYSRSRSAEELISLGLVPMGLHELFSNCDYVSVHCLLTPENYRIVDAACFENCRPGLILVNTARGGLVDEGALYEALKEKKLAAAGLDVFESEPPDTGLPLFTLDNFLAGMHVAGSTREALRRGGEAVVNSVFEALGIEE
ncbi:MAG: 3-phosphoglycerate dehydrogenase [Clostridia bacterium]|nr:3-phosphoglycerate dehydrogenase [Clostridia bacterium]